MVPELLDLLEVLLDLEFFEVLEPEVLELPDVEDFELLDVEEPTFSFSLVSVFCESLVFVAVDSSEVLLSSTLSVFSSVVS